MLWQCFYHTNVPPVTQNISKRNDIVNKTWYVFHEMFLFENFYDPLEVFKWNVANIPRILKTNVLNMKHKYHITVI